MNRPSKKQIEILRLIEIAGPGGLDFYWYPSRGQKNLINGNAERALVRSGFIKSEWRKGPLGETGMDYFGQSRRFAVLTDMGQDALKLAVAASQDVVRAKHAAVWQTIPHRPRSKTPPWKSPMGERCPHGLDIYKVNGTYVRNHFDSDFDQGGNPGAYSFVPAGEIWIDSHVPQVEVPYVAYHECLEAEMMRKGVGYDRAHARAKAAEDKRRRLNWPGE